ncbi:MAG: hypothetical protein PQJ44_02305 [Sphaerochaetaceae bacterium]|nr:hypothetical protein [Sphaerochaetaceae bacterium]
MAKKLSEIKDYIDSSTAEFERYLKTQVSPDLYSKILSIASVSNVFVFSGIIRNYFLNIDSNRDLDLVLDKKINIEDYFHSGEIKKNSYGGYKIIYKKQIIDLWYVNDTWAFKFQKSFDFANNLLLPETSFFNFSSIIYHINSNRFIYTKHFLRFIRDKRINVVFKPNANYDLCIINTIYYSKKYDLKIAEKLQDYIVDLFYEDTHNFESIQKKHFGKVIYSNNEIEEFVTNLHNKNQRGKRLVKDQLKMF